MKKRETEGETYPVSKGPWGPRWPQWARTQLCTGPLGPEDVLLLGIVVGEDVSILMTIGLNIVGITEGLRRLFRVGAAFFKAHAPDLILFTPASKPGTVIWD